MEKLRDGSVTGTGETRRYCFTTPSMPVSIHLLKIIILCVLLSKQCGTFWKTEGLESTLWIESPWSFQFTPFLGFLSLTFFHFHCFSYFTVSLYPKTPLHFQCLQPPSPPASLPPPPSTLSELFKHHHSPAFSDVICDLLSAKSFCLFTVLFFFPGSVTFHWLAPPGIAFTW